MSRDQQIVRSDRLALAAEVSADLGIGAIRSSVERQDLETFQRLVDTLRELNGALLGHTIAELTGSADACADRGYADHGEPLGHRTLGVSDEIRKSVGIHQATIT